MLPSFSPSELRSDTDGEVVCSRHALLFLRRGILQHLSRSQGDSQHSRLRQLDGLDAANALQSLSMALLATASLY